MLAEKDIMEPLISIGIPVKNGFQNKTKNDIDLEIALNSVLKQSYKNNFFEGCLFNSKN